MHVRMVDISSDNPNNLLKRLQIKESPLKKHYALCLLTFSFNLQVCARMACSLLMSWKQRLPWQIAIGEHSEQ